MVVELVEPEKLPDPVSTRSFVIVIAPPLPAKAPPLTVAVLGTITVPTWKVPAPAVTVPADSVKVPEMLVLPPWPDSDPVDEWLTLPVMVVVAAEPWKLPDVCSE